MSNLIRLKGKITTGAPNLSDLAERELCVVIPDGDLYGRMNGSIVYLGGSKNAQKDSPAFTGTPTAPTPAGSSNGTQIATTAFVQALIASFGAGDMVKSTYDTNNDGKVNAADNADALGGSAASNYALKSYVDTAISNLIAAAPGTLDTLNELAAALGDDANFASTVTTALGTKLDANSTIDGGTF